MEEALTAQLLASAGLLALVGERITWGLREPGSPLPALVLTLISARPDYTTTGASGLTDNLIQADCWGATYAEAKAVARAVIDVCAQLSAPFRGPAFVESERDDAFQAAAPDADGGTDLFRTSLDLRAWHYAP